MYIFIDHMFCRRCLNNYEKPSCPLCMEPLDKTNFQLSKFVKRQISRLRVRCIYKPLGCSWEGVLEDNHSASVINININLNYIIISQNHNHNSFYLFIYFHLLHI